MSQTLSPLFNHEAEMSVVGAFLQEAGTHKHIPGLAPEDFSDPILRALFRAIQTLYAQRKTIDIVTVDTQTQLDLGDAFRHEYLVKATDAIIATPTSAHTDAYVDLIRQCAARRRLAAAARSLGEMAGDGAISVEEAIERTRSALREITHTSSLWEGVNAVLAATQERIDQTLSGLFQPVRTGIQPMDCVFGGFVPGELTVLGARPGVGKSAFAGEIAVSAALSGKRVGVVSLEMSDVQYGQRLVAASSGVDSKAIRRAELSDQNLFKIAEALDGLSTLPMAFLFRCRTVEQLACAVHQRKEEEGLDLLIIDYLQLLRSERIFRSEYERVTHVSRSVKELAVLADVPILAMAQLSRAGAVRMDKRPVLSDLRDSGSIEQDADNVILIHSPEDREDAGVFEADKPYFDGYKARGFHYLHVAIVKQRQGELGAGGLLFDPRIMRFIEVGGAGAGP